MAFYYFTIFWEDGILTACVCINRWWSYGGEVLCHLPNPGLFPEIEEEAGRVLWLPSYQEKCYEWDTGMQ